CRLCRRRGLMPLIVVMRTITAHQIHQPVDIDGFLNDGFDIQIAWRLESGYRDYRHRGECCVPHLFATKLPSVHHRHLKVEDNKRRERPAMQELERLASISAGCDRKALVAEKVTQGRPGACIVFDD
ncbi:MAG TPA: hypothetical protein VMT64_09480, partial [Candidatus Binataceae bacterium]|nr:hypothetical protein [Candidatus Binataceae bacterium]